MIERSESVREVSCLAVPPRRKTFFRLVIRMDHLRIRSRNYALCRKGHLILRCQSRRNWLIG